MAVWCEKRARETRTAGVKVRVRMRLFKLLFVAAGLLLGSVVFAADDVVVEAKRQLDSGNAQAAYDLLNPLQAERAGDPQYDFLLGTAALQLGRNTEAVFALERVLAVDPNAAPARALIARAYFNLKETETARREFENVRKQQDLPEDVALTIDRFLDAISRIEEEQGIVVGGFFEFGGGYDSNVNSAAAIDQVAIPAFGGLNFTLAASAQEQSDTYFNTGFGLNMRVAMSKRWTAFGGASFARKSNHDATDFSTEYYDARLGINYSRNRDALVLVLQSSGLYLDDPVYTRAYRRANGGTLQWQHDFSAKNRASAFLQYSQLKYPQQEVRDADRTVGGVGWAHAFGKTNSFVSYLGLYGGTEDEQDENFPHLGHDLYGARVGAQQFLSEAWSIFLNAAYEQRDYHGIDPSFLVTREDSQASASTGIYFIPSKGFTISPVVTWVDNQSNITINEYDRWTAAVNVRYDF